MRHDVLPRAWRHHAELDAFDLTLLKALQVQADLGHAKLAEQTHLSPSACSRRVQRLREEGFLDRTVTLLNPDRLGLAVKCFVLIKLCSHVEDHRAFFANLAERSAEIVECCLLAGETDYLLKVCTTDLKNLGEFLQACSRSRAVATVRSSIVLETVKETTALPIPDLDQARVVPFRARMG